MVSARTALRALAASCLPTLFALTTGYRPLRLRRGDLRVEP